MPGAWVTEKPLGQEFIAVTEVNKFLKGISHAKAHVNLVEDKPGSVAVTPPVGREVKLSIGYDAKISQNEEGVTETMLIQASNSVSKEWFSLQSLT